MINKNQLKTIIQDLQSIIEELRLYGVTNETIFTEATSYQRGLMVGESRTMSNYSKQEKTLPRPSNDLKQVELATPKQKATLIRLGEYFEGITKEEAWKRIKLAKDKNY